MTHVLVLNSSYRPLQVTSVRRALTLLRMAVAAERHLRGPIARRWRSARTGATAATIDHRVNRTWDNVVAACGPRNRRKANRIPAEAGLRLDRAPRHIARALLEPRLTMRGELPPRLRGSVEPPAWRKYLPA